MDPKTPRSTQSQAQLALDGIMAQIEVSNLSDLPNGVSRLSAGELKFVQAYIETGRKSEAARLAGYSEHSAHEISRKLFKKVAVREFFAFCVKQVAEKSSQLVARTWQRSVIAHSRILELEDKRDLARHDPKAPKFTDHDRVELKDYYRAAERSDTLLGGLLGKLPALNLNVSTGGGDAMVTIGKQTAMNLAAMRQEVLLANRRLQEESSQESGVRINSEPGEEN